MKTKDVIAQAEKEFDEKFKCIQGDCAGGGHTYPTEEEPEGGQCQFCAEYLFPMKSFLSSYTKDLLQSVVELQDEKFNAYLAKFSEDRPPKPAHIRKYLMEVLSSSLSDIITNIKWIEFPTY